MCLTKSHSVDSQVWAGAKVGSPPHFQWLLNAGGGGHGWLCQEPTHTMLVCRAPLRPRGSSLTPLQLTTPACPSWLVSTLLLPYRCLRNKNQDFRRREDSTSKGKWEGVAGPMIKPGMSRRILEMASQRAL